jgi:protein CpxP
MNTFRKSILIGLTVLGLASASFAVQAQDGRPGHAATQEQRQAKWSEHSARRQAKVHDALKLTAAQEPAWTTYQAAIKPVRGTRGDRAAWAGLSAPARMEKMIAMSKQRTAMMESRLGALNTFYAVLTPEQKKVFDENSKRGGAHHGHRMKGTA